MLKKGAGGSRRGTLWGVGVGVGGDRVSLGEHTCVPGSKGHIEGSCQTPQPGRGYDPLPATAGERKPRLRRWEGRLEEQGGEGMYQSGFGFGEAEGVFTTAAPMIQLWKTGASLVAQFSWALTPGPLLD